MRLACKAAVGERRIGNHPCCCRHAGASVAARAWRRTAEHDMRAWCGCHGGHGSWRRDRGARAGRGGRLFLLCIISPASAGLGVLVRHRGAGGMCARVSAGRSGRARLLRRNLWSDRGWPAAGRGANTADWGRLALKQPRRLLRSHGMASASEAPPAAAAASTAPSSTEPSTGPAIRTTHRLGKIGRVSAPRAGPTVAGAT